MADEPKYRDEELPITAEIGGEGGSFGDETYQQSEKKGERGPGVTRIDRPQPEPPDVRRPE